MASRRLRRFIGLAALLAALAVVAPAAAATDFTWRGHAPSGDPEWSNPANWQGGVPPSGSVGTLRFPKLGGGCSVTSQPTTCYSASNDLTGVSAHAVSLDTSQGYSLFGNALTIGAGGLTAEPATNKCPCGFTGIFMPIVLGADQAWSMAGPLLTMASKVTGQPHSLHIAVAANMDVQLSDFEVGALTINGTAPDVFATPFVSLEPHASRPDELNGVDRQPLDVSKIYFRASHADVGPLTVNNAVLSGTGNSKPGKLSVEGGVTLDSRSEVIVYVTHSGASAGKDYWQLGATGPVDLGKASLIVDASSSNGFGANQPCPKLKRGKVETLIKTKGALTGKFAGIHNKGKVQVDCEGSKRPTLRIRYKKHSVTAKVL